MIPMTPTYVDPFLGAGSVWLALLDPGLVAPVSWMGGKRRLARELLQLLELVPGRPVASVVGDASWWGWVWQVVLDPDRGPAVSAWLRSWRGEPPRDLWFRLRDAGPPDDIVERAAGLLWLQARAASGVPVWWQDRMVSMDGHGRGPYPAWQATGLPALVQDRGWKSTTTTTTTLYTAKQKMGQEPRLVATTRGNGQAPGAPYDAGCKGAPLIQMANGSGPYEASMAGDRLLASDGRGVARGAGHKADKDGGGRTGGIVDPGTIADRLDAIRRAVKSTTVILAGARELTEEWAPRLGAAGRWYFDPPYQGATGYPVTCSRDEVLAIVELPARHGAPVVVSEAVGLAAELGRGWSQAQLRRGKKQEWVTVYGCDVRAALPPILRLAAGGA